MKYNSNINTNLIDINNNEIYSYIIDNNDEKITTILENNEQDQDQKLNIKKNKTCKTTNYINNFKQNKVLRKILLLIVVLVIIYLIYNQCETKTDPNFKLGNYVPKFNF